MATRQGAIAVFVKTPGYSPLKTRLAEGIGQQQAEDFYRLSVQAVASVVTAAAQQTGVIPCWAVAEDAALSDPLWSDFVTIPQGAGDLGTRLAHVNRVLSEQHDFVIFLGADAPQLPVSFLTEAIRMLEQKREPSQFVMGPASDGGFYLFGTQNCVTAEVWCNVPYSADNTARQLRAELAAAGEMHLLPTLTDVDTARDLLAIEEEARESNQLEPAQRAVLEWIRGQNYSSD